MPLPSRPAFAKKVCSPNSPTTRLLTAALALLAALALGACNDSSTNLKALTVDPDDTTIEEGDTQQFSALGTYDDDTTADFTTGVYWSSASTGIVSINQDGLATAEGEGQTTISATDGVTGVFDSATVTVLPAPVSMGNPSSSKSLEDTITFTVDGTEETYQGTAAANPVGFDPWVYTEYDAATGRTVIAARWGYNSSVFFFDNWIELVVDGQNAGNYDYPTNDNGRIYLERSGARHEIDFQSPINTSVNISVDEIGAVDTAATGSFSAVLCDESIVFSESAGDECADTANQVTITGGTFNATRGPDLGTLTNPRYLDKNSGSQMHRLDAGYADETYYVMYEVTPGMVYSVELRNMDEDLDLIAYGGDATFSTPVVCDLVNNTLNAGPAPEKCAITASGGDDLLYFKVVRQDPFPVGQAFYDIEARDVPPGVELSIEIVAIVDNPGSDEIVYRITNNGATPASGSVDVDFFQAPGAPPAISSPGDVGANPGIAIPPAGGTFVGTLSYSIGPAGSFAYVTVDRTNTFSEADEGNNVSPGFAWGTLGTAYYVDTYQTMSGCCTNTFLELSTPDASGALITNDNAGPDGGNGYSGFKFFANPGRPMLFRVYAVSGPTDYPYTIEITDGGGFATGPGPAAPANPDSFEPDDTPQEATPLFINVPQVHTVASPDSEDFFIFNQPN